MLGPRSLLGGGYAWPQVPSKGGMPGPRFLLRVDMPDTLPERSERYIPRGSYIPSTDI